MFKFLRKTNTTAEATTKSQWAFHLYDINYNLIKKETVEGSNKAEAIENATKKHPDMLKGEKYVRCMGMTWDARNHRKEVK